MNNTITIRRIAASEAEMLAQLGRECFLEAFGDCEQYTQKDLDDFLDEAYASQKMAAHLTRDTTFCQVVEKSGVALGYILVGLNKLPLVKPQEPAYEIMQLYLLEPLHGKGIADQLMESALEFCSNQGAGSIHLGVWENNFRAQKFYARHGFKPVGNYIFMVGSVEDHEIIMQWQSAA